MITSLKDFGVSDALVSIGIDVTSAMGMAQRVGLNKVRHVKVGIIWTQEQQARKRLPLRAILGRATPQTCAPIMSRRRCSSSTSSNSQSELWKDDPTARYQARWGSRRPDDL